MKKIIRYSLAIMSLLSASYLLYIIITGKEYLSSISLYADLLQVLIALGCFIVLIKGKDYKIGWILVIISLTCIDAVTVKNMVSVNQTFEDRERRKVTDQEIISIMKSNAIDEKDIFLKNNEVDLGIACVLKDSSIRFYGMDHNEVTSLASLEVDGNIDIIEDTLEQYSRLYLSFFAYKEDGLYRYLFQKANWESEEYDVEGKEYYIGKKNQEFDEEYLLNLSTAYGHNNESIIDYSIIPDYELAKGVVFYNIGYNEYFEYEATELSIFNEYDEVMNVKNFGKITNQTKIIQEENRLVISPIIREEDGKEYSVQLIIRLKDDGIDDYCERI